MQLESITLAIIPDKHLSEEGEEGTRTQRDGIGWNRMEQDIIEQKRMAQNEIEENVMGKTGEK